MAGQIKAKIKDAVKSNIFKASLFIIVLSIIISIPMFSPDFNIQIDDGVQHICRLIGTEQSIEEGQLIPVIMSNFCNGFGYSWNLFYSPITSYIPLIFRLFTNSYAMCLKIFILLVNIITGYSMYFFVKKFLKGRMKENKIEAIAILASSLYILFPYRLNDMYVRIAIPELTSFIFLPIVFNGLYSIINLKEKSWLLVLGAVGMLLTHSMLTIYLVMFCVIYLVINIKKIDKKTLLVLLENAGIILLVTAFYWIPLLESRLSADYEVFNEAHMIRWDVMEDLKVKPYELFLYQNGRMFYGLGIVVILGAVLSLTVLGQKVLDRKNYIFFLIAGVISVIMTLNFFPFEKLPSIFTMMQFSFRMLEFGGFFLIVVASIALGMTFERFNIYSSLCLVCISLLLLIPNISRLQYGEYYSEEDLVKGIEVTSSTGRVHPGCASFEYLPSKAFNNRKYIEEREDVPIILSEKTENLMQSENATYEQEAKIENFNKDGTNCSFEIVANTVDESLEIELPYIYYIGYNVEYTDDSGNNYSVETYESENGFLCIRVPNENVTVNVKYTGTVLMKIAYIISAVTVLVLIIIYFIKRVNKKSRNEGNA